jgi:DNA-binding response OmpR family regulator
MKKALSAEAYAVDVAADGREALQAATEVDYDLVILDLGLPGMDGSEVLKNLRAKRVSAKIMVLSGRAGLEDRVKGLNLGADDYMTKPFSVSELAARVRALLRRHGPATDICLKVADLELNRVERTVHRAGRRIDLTVKEFALLEYLMRHAGHCMTRAALIEHVWNLGFDGQTNVVDVYINYLRRKIDQGFSQRLIHTVRGFGYQICEPEVPQVA